MSQHEKVKNSDRVKTLREKLKLTQPELAEKLRISANYVYQIEADRKPLVGRTLEDFEKLEMETLPGHTKPDSVKPPVDRFVDQPDDKTDWKQRAILAEDRLEQLQANIRAALNISTAPPAPLSSAPKFSPEQEFGKRAGARYDSDQKK